MTTAIAYRETRRAGHNNEPGTPIGGAVSSRLTRFVERGFAAQDSLRAEHYLTAFPSSFPAHSVADSRFPQYAG